MINYDLSQVPAAWLATPTLTPGTPNPVALYRPVLALTITRGNQVLACIRDPKTNPIHPGVLSVPTIRLGGTHPEEIRDGAWSLGPMKLGTPAFLNLRQYMTWQGHSLIGSLDGQPVTYPLTLINGHVDFGVTDTSVDFPPATEEYSWIGWVYQEDFIQAAEKGDTFWLGREDIDCDTVMYGLCCQSTTAMLNLVQG